MKINKSQKKFIRANLDKLSIGELAKELSVPADQIKAYLEKIGKKPSLNATKGKGVSTPKSADPRPPKTLRDVQKFITGNIDFVIILALVCTGIYINSLGGDFVSDDIAEFVRNPQVRDFAGSFWTFNLQKILYASVFSTFGLSSVPLHIASLLLHTAVTVMVFVFTAYFFGKRVSIIASLLFTVHPINTEAVAWISAINYLFNALGFFLVAIPYYVYKNSNEPKYYWISSGVFLFFAVFTQNPWAAVIPLALVVVDQFFIEKRFELKSLDKLIPFFVIAGGLFLYHQGIFRGKVESISGSVVPQWAQEAKYTQRYPYSIYSALELYAVPKNLTIYHEGEPITYTMFYVMVAVSMLFTLATVFLIFKKRKLAGLPLFFFATIAPVLSPVQVGWFVAERYLYLGTMAFTISLALLFTWLEDRFNSKKLATALTVFFLIIYSIRTVMRNSEWKTRKSLWESTARVSPRSAKVHNNLGDVYVLEGDYQKSLDEFQKAILIDPNFAEAYHNLGNTLLRIEDYDNAEKMFFKSLELQPLLYQSYLKLAVVEEQRGDIDKAIEYLNKSLEINPHYVDALNALEIIKQQQTQ